MHHSVKKCEKAIQIVEKHVISASSKQRIISHFTCLACQDNSFQIWQSIVGPSVLFSCPGTMWLLYVPYCKSAVKGTRFQTVETLKQKATKSMKDFTKEHFQYCFNEWKIHMQRLGDRRDVSALKGIITKSSINFK